MATRLTSARGQRNQFHAQTQSWPLAVVATRQTISAALLILGLHPPKLDSLLPGDGVTSGTGGRPVRPPPSSEDSQHEHPPAAIAAPLGPVPATSGARLGLGTPRWNARPPPPEPMPQLGLPTPKPCARARYRTGEAALFLGRVHVVRPALDGERLPPLRA